ncbi:MAG: YkgJ family cysteine cluster protein [Ekhidna sp.]|uniref:YkgJ family cysteine cluster protein n=1 Tax=Ekhidna sp. TaxID=2608089 RepID=UPI0032ED39C0
MEKLFRLVEKDVATFQQATEMKCKTGCGMCCLKPDISASPLEFLPFAYHLFKTNQAHEWLEKFRKDDRKICHNLNAMLGNQDGGFCSSYQYRGLICRLFGFSAMLGKNKVPQLVTCKTIKEEYPASVARANAMIDQRRYVPILSNYYHQLRMIDPDLGRDMMPINRAIAEAIKTVLAYYSYRNPRKVG